MTVPRILFVTHAYPRFVGDAPGSFVHRLVQGVQALGAEVRVLAPHAEGLADRELLDGVPLHRYRYATDAMETLAYTGTMAEQVLGSWRGKVAFGGMLLAGSRALRREIRAFRPTVVHAHWWFPSGMLAAMGAGATPVVITMHGSDVRLAVSRPMVHSIARRVLDRAAVVTAVSDWLARQATTLGTRHAIHVAPMAVDIDRFQPTNPLGHVAVWAERPVVFAGRLNAQKGLADLIDAMARLQGSATLQVVGEGEDRAALEARAAQRGIAHRIQWLGRGTPERIAEAFRGAAAVVLPSREEGLGLIAVEAQLCGAPVIGYRSGGLPDVIDPAWGGVLVEAGDIAQLAGAIDAALASAPDPTMRGAAIEVMHERFAPQAVAERYLALYREVGTHG